MKFPTPLLVLFLLGFLTACSRQSAAIPGCLRFTDLSPTQYRLESGSLRRDGFVADQSEDYAYSQNLHVRSEVVPVSGKTILSLNYWNALPSSLRYHRSQEAWTINGTTFVAIAPNP